MDGERSSLVEPTRVRWRLVALWVATVLGLAVVAAAFSPRLAGPGGELFGRLIRLVQRRPATTVALALGVAAGAWLGIGLGVALQSRPGHEPPQPGPDGDASTSTGAR
jgi:hypothetical protein